MWSAATGSRRLALTECPRSYVTAESYVLLEDFLAHRLLGALPELDTWPARRADAFTVLQRELAEAQRSNDAQ